MRATWSPVLTPESVTVLAEIIPPLANRYLGAAKTGTFKLRSDDIKYLEGARDFSDPLVREAIIGLIDAVSAHGIIQIVIE